MAPLPLRVMFAALELVHHVPTAFIPTVGDQLSVQEIINVHEPIEPTTALIHDTTSPSPTATFIASPLPTNTVVVTFESLERRAEPDEDDDDDTSSTPTTTKRPSSTKTRGPRSTTTVTVTSSVFSYMTSKTSQTGKFLGSSTHSDSDDDISTPIPSPLVATYSSISSITTVKNLFQDADWSPPEAQSLRNNRAHAVIGASVGVIAVVLLGLVWSMRVRAARRRMIKYGVALPSGAEKPENWNGKLRNVWRIRRMKKAEDQRLKDEMATRYGGNGAASSATLTAFSGFHSPKPSQ